MDHFNDENPLELVSGKYSIEKDTRGWIYVLKDAVYPGLIKIGRTQDLDKRLKAYNDSRPYPSVKVLCVSKQFKDVVAIERVLLDALYLAFNTTPRKLEWFDAKHIDYLVNLIEQAETSYD